MSKLNDVFNYRAWLIIIRSILWSYLLLDIVNVVEVMFLGFDKANDKISKIFGKEK